MTTDGAADVPPDTKDWTWVLSRPCPECGLDVSALALSEVPRIVRESASAWVDVLQRPDVRRRPAPAVWSPLEYGCHVRDVYQIFSERLGLMLGRENPSFPNWDQDATARDADYGSQDPETVARELLQAGTTVAAAFSSVTGPQWDRLGHRSDGSTFTVASLARYFIHDPVHHLHDVGSAPLPSQASGAE